MPACLKPECNCVILRFASLSFPTCTLYNVQYFPGVSLCHGQSSWWWDWSSPRTSWEYFSCFGWACLCGIWGICFVTMTYYLDFSNSQPVRFNNLNHKKVSSILCWSLSIVAAVFHIFRGRVLKVYLSTFKVFGLRGRIKKNLFFGIQVLKY